jgi:hypothetical protein
VSPAQCETDFIESDVIESDVIESDVIESDVIESDVIESDVIESDVIESDVIESDIIKSDVIKSDVIKSDVIKSDVIKSDVIKDCEKIKDRYRTFSKLQIGGTVMMFGGLAAIISGSVMTSEGNKRANNGAFLDGFASSLFGPFITIIGVPLSIGGLTMLAIGEKKKSEYKKQLCLQVHPSGCYLVLDF